MKMSLLQILGHLHMKVSFRRVAGCLGLNVDLMILDNLGRNERCQRLGDWKELKMPMRAERPDGDMCKWCS